MNRAFFSSTQMHNKWWTVTEQQTGTGPKLNIEQYEANLLQQSY